MPAPPDGLAPRSCPLTVAGNNPAAEDRLTHHRQTGSLKAEQRASPSAICTGHHPGDVLDRELGFAVAFGILLDTIIVRSVLVTALNLDIGRWMWWPGRLARTPDPGADNIETNAERNRIYLHASQDARRARSEFIAVLAIVATTVGTFAPAPSAASI